MGKIIRNPGDAVPTPLGYNRSDLVVAIEWKRQIKCSLCYLYRSNLCYKKNKDTIFGPCRSEDRGDGINIIWELYSSRDRYLGEEFVPYNGRTKLKVVRSLYDSHNDRCIGCFYNRRTTCYNRSDHSGACSSFSREDEVNVIFKKISSNDNNFNLPEYIDNTVKLAICKVCPYSDECNKTEEEMNINESCMFKLIRKDL